MNASPHQLHTCKSPNIKQFWNTKLYTLQHHITATPHYYHKKICSCTYYFQQWWRHSIELNLHYYKKAIHRSNTAYKSVTTTNEGLKTSQYETHLKHEHFTVSTHIIYSSIFVIIAEKHMPASTIWCLQKLGLVRLEWVTSACS